jgi:hypothetical protein
MQLAAAFSLPDVLQVIDTDGFRLDFNKNSIVLCSVSSKATLGLHTKP